MSTALTVKEKSTLQECEEVIERGLDGFIEIGNAFLRIRNEKLYRAKFGTFQEYCETKWQMGRAHAYRLIDAAEVAGNLSPIGDISITESQARPLVGLKPTQQREAWEEAVAKSGGKPTAKDVKAAVGRIDPSRVRPISPAPASQEQLKKASEAEKDSETLWLLKSYWKKATKADRTLFRAWIEDNT